MNRKIIVMAIAIVLSVLAAYSAGAGRKQQ